MEITQNEVLLILLRHCNTQLNDENKYQGQKYDYDLSSIGVNQALSLKEKLLPFLRKCKVEDAIISDSNRTSKTVSLIFGEEENVVRDKKLLPFDLGEADGKTEDELKTIKRFPNPLLYRGMENFIKYMKRIKKATKEAILKNRGKIFALCTHEDVTGFIHTRLTGASFIKTPKLGIPNGECRIYKIDISKMKKTFKGIKVIEYLDSTEEDFPQELLKLISEDKNADINNNIEAEKGIIKNKNAEIKDSKEDFYK